MALSAIAPINPDAAAYGAGTIERLRAGNAAMTDQPDLQLPAVYLTPKEVAERWRVSLRSLERWRLAGRGPGWISIGGGIRYPVEAVLDYEQRQRLVPARATGGDHDHD